jgi:DNA-binding protein YbaB
MCSLSALLDCTYPPYMLDNLKMLSALSGVLKNKDKLAGAADRVKDRLAGVRCSGEAGGGAVRVTVSGKMEVLSVQIAPALANGMATDAATRDRAGGLIAEATNIALAQAQTTLKETIEREAKDMGLDGIPDIAGLGKMLGGR